MINDWIKIGENDWNVTVLSINENLNMLYSENTGRTMSIGARMTLDPLGAYLGHKITVKPKNNDFQSFDALFDYLSIPRYDGIHIKAVHNQSVIEYDAYVSTLSRDVKRIDDKNNVVYWDKMDINIIPMEAQILPQ